MATNIITLNQLISWFEDFSNRHYMLKDFGFGEPYDIGTSRQMDFPYMWVTMNEDGLISTATNIRSSIPEFSFSVMFMDKINIQENYLNVNGFNSDNSQEILSDMVQILQDLVTEIQQYWGQYGVLFSQDVSFYPVIDETTDKSTGVVGRIVFRLKQVNCIIPASPFPIVTTTTTTCPVITTQYVQGELISNTKIRASLWNDSGYTSSANAICNYEFYGEMSGDLGTEYSGMRIFPEDAHQLTWNFQPELQSGESITAFTINNVVITCPCVNLIY